MFEIWECGIQAIVIVPSELKPEIREWMENGGWFFVQRLDTNELSVAGKILKDWSARQDPPLGRKRLAVVNPEAMECLEELENDE